MAAPLRQETYARLHHAILSGDFLPGERLVETTLCQMFGVSRPVLREVVRSLESQGLVTMIPNRGPIVTILTPKEASDIFDVRAMLEGLLAKLFAERASESQRQSLLEAERSIARAFESDDTDAWTRSKDGYYDTLMVGADNDAARDMLRTLHARIQVLRRLSLSAPGRKPETLAEVRNITAAAVGGDPDGAFEAAVSHVKNAAKVAVASLESAMTST